MRWSALTIAAFAISTMPFAASTTESPSGSAQRSSIARLRALEVEIDLAAEEVARVEPAEHEVRVGDRRLRAAAAVADRPRVGARALRPDAQQAARVDPGDRAATGADLDEVDDGRPHRVARQGHAADPGPRVPADVVVLRHRRAAVLDQADLRGRAAHVEGEDVRPAERLAEVRRGDHARGRPRLDHEDRTAAGGIGAEDAAARLHHEQLRLARPRRRAAARSARGSARRPAGWQR